MKRKRRVSHSQRRGKQLRIVEAELRRSGLPWRIERGSRHLKLFIGGTLAMVLSADGNNTDSRQIRSIVRRYARGTR